MNASNYKRFRGGCYTPVKNSYFNIGTGWLRDVIL